jgi:hypothetical protein
MKPILFLLSLLVCGTVFAQKPFQGTVIYKLHATGGEVDLEFKVHFGLNQLKITSRELGSWDRADKTNQYLLINLDSGNVFTVSDKFQTYEYSRLLEQNAASLQPIERKIANHAVTPVMWTSQFVGSHLSDFSGEGIFYKAGDLFYPIPKKYSNDERLAFVLDNHIVLGADVLPVPERYNKQNDTTRFKITARAISVTKESFTKDFFQLPAGYKLIDYSDPDYLDSVRVADSFKIMIIDSAADKSVDSIQRMIDSTELSYTTIAPSKKDNGKQPPLTQNAPAKTPAIKPKKSKS